MPANPHTRADIRRLSRWARARGVQAMLVAVTVFACSIATLVPEIAWAADTTAQPTAPARVKRHRVVRPKVIRSSSDESVAERDRRMYRECRGRPNGGACLGYAS